jgi:predicted signal transduction protein with EAL and GGDEF domain
MAQRFIDMVRQPIETSAGLVSVGASLGFAVYPLHATSAEALKKAADIAMYTAKRNRSGWLLFAPHMSEHSDKDEPGK